MLLIKRKRIQTFLDAEDGSTVIEFGVLAIPFFMIVFAIIETMVAFAGEQVLQNAADTMARKLRTGQITFNLGKTTDLTETEFRTEFCSEISVLLSCSSTSDKLFIDLQQVSDYGDIATNIPLSGSGTYAQLDTSSFSYSPGGSQAINVMRVYYKWDVTADLIRPYISNIRTADGSGNYYLMVATLAFRNEGY